MYAFLSLIHFMGFWALLLLMWFPCVVFIAFFVLLFNKMWLGALSIVLAAMLTFGIRLFAFWLGRNAGRSRHSRYDVSYYEPKGHTDDILPG